MQRAAEWFALVTALAMSFSHLMAVQFVEYNRAGPAMKLLHYSTIVVLLLGTWLTAERLMRRRTVPPASVANFPAFVEWQRSPRDIEVIRQGGAEYLLATGSWGGLLPSGTSGYVFDHSGRLVDWSSDMGDDSRFQDKWLPSSPKAGPHLDLNGAAKWLSDRANPAE